MLLEPQISVNEPHVARKPRLGLPLYRIIVLLCTFVFPTQTINNRIIKDHKGVSKQYYDKFKDLRAERFRCIKERAKNDLDIDLDLGELEREDTEETLTGNLFATESDMALTVDVTAAGSDDGENGEAKPPPPPESQDNAMEVPELPEQSRFASYRILF